MYDLSWHAADSSWRDTHKRVGSKTTTPLLVPLGPWYQPIMSDRAIIDASMLLHRDSLNHLKGLALAGGLENLVISDALVRLAADEQMLVRVMGRYLGITRGLLDLDSLRQLLPLLEEQVPRYSREADYQHPIYQNLIDRIGNEWITQVLFEEWEFLISNSWLFAKLRKSIDDLIEAGASAFQTSKEKFDRITRRLLNKQSQEPLSPNDKVMATAKWIAIGGPPIVGAFEPISGSVLTSLGGVFILADP